MLSSKLKEIADAIRAKTGKTDKIKVNDMPSEILSIETGGEPIDIFPLGGLNPVLVDEHYESWTLDDTSFERGVSQSTSATSILASVSNKYTNTTGSPTLAYGDKDIIAIQQCYAKPTHEGGDGKAQQIDYVYLYISYFSKRKTSDTSAKTTRQINNTTGYLCRYNNTSGTSARAVSNYGFYMTPSAPSVYSATAASTYLRFTSPTLYYRVNSTYEKAANILKVTECNFEWKILVYTVDPFTAPNAAIQDLINSIMINGAVQDSIYTNQAQTLSLDDELINDNNGEEIDNG